MVETLTKFFGKFYEATFEPAKKAIRSDKCKSCMKKSGPYLVALFYSYQLLHVYCYTFVFSPKLLEILPQPLAYLLILIGYFMLYKANYVYTITRLTPAGKPQDLKKLLIRDKQMDKFDKELSIKFSHDLVETIRYSNIVQYETIEKVSELRCNKCQEFKPLRAHHCNSCNTCTLLMDHHCIWTNCCIGLHNYKYFLQMNFYGTVGAFYMALIMRITSEDAFFASITSYISVMKFLDLLIGKLLLMIFAWNMYIMISGYTMIEFQYLSDRQAKIKTNEVENEQPRSIDDDIKKPVLFQYGYKTFEENFARVFLTNNYLCAFLFTDYFHDKRIEVNGIEWTEMYFWDDLQRHYQQINQSDEQFEKLSDY